LHSGETTFRCSRTDRLEIQIGSPVQANASYAFIYWDWKSSSPQDVPNLQPHMPRTPGTKTRAARKRNLPGPALLPGQFRSFSPTNQDIKKPPSEGAVLFWTVLRITCLLFAPCGAPRKPQKVLVNASQELHRCLQRRYTLFNRHKNHRTRVCWGREYRLQRYCGAPFETRRSIWNQGQPQPQNQRHDGFSGCGRPRKRSVAQLAAGSVSPACVPLHNFRVNESSWPVSIPGP
jgi:hypothetical protein